MLSISLYFSVVCSLFSSLLKRQCNDVPGRPLHEFAQVKDSKNQEEETVPEADCTVHGIEIQ